ncbi:MAG: hypothetical protein QXT98_01320 [Archaeoglobaceae archaeon]
MMHITNKNSEIQEKILNFLKTLGEKRVEFDIDDAVSKLSLNREVFEEELFRLQRMGLLKIIRIPLSNNVLNLIQKEIRELDALFLANWINREDYFVKLDTIGRLVEILGWEIAPINIEELGRIICDLKKKLEYLLKLEKLETQSHVKAILIDKNEKEIQELLIKLRRIVYALFTYFDKIRAKLEEINLKFELIELECKLNGVRNDFEFQKLVEELNLILKNTETVLETSIKKEYFDRAKEELKKIEERIEILKAKSLVENKDFSKEIKSLEAKLEDLKSKVNLFLGISIPELKNILQTVYEMKILNKEIYIELGNCLYALEELILFSRDWNDFRKNLSLPKELYKLISAIQRIEQIESNLKL